ncbi:MAG: alanine racemase, partial [Actinomycetota bacterium]
RGVDVLVEVNVSGEEAKAGVAPDAVALLVDEIARVEGVRLRGLMTMAPRVGSPEEARPYFRRLAELRDELDARFPGAGIRELSMGMSQDYEIAVEEGATLVRVGAAIFGPRATRTNGGSGRDDRAGATAPASLR